LCPHGWGSGHLRVVCARKFAVGGPVNPRTGKPFGTTSQAWADWASAQGKPVLNDEQFSLVKAIGAGVAAHSGVSALLADGMAESVARAEYCGRRCQIRLDWFNPIAGIVDLKSCDDLTWFETDARRYQYVHQMAFYRAVLAKASGFVAPVHLVAIEKKEPFRCGVWLIAESALDYAQKENEAAIARMLRCESDGDWPTGYEEPRVFDSF